VLKNRRSDRHVLDPALARHLCNIHGIFEENNEIIVGVGDGA
jgi:desulfoferrodoxin (superoxide reductase-like protein)